MSKKNKKKKTNTPRHKRLNRKSRLQAAGLWIAGYTGKCLIRGYVNHFAVDRLCAMLELQSLGVKISAQKIAGERAEQERRHRHAIAKKERKKAEQGFTSEYGIIGGYDENFSYIAGFTGWGFPYGLTWEEWNPNDLDADTPQGGTLFQRMVDGQEDTSVILKVTLSGTEPPVWRRMEVTCDTTLANLHQVFQTTFGWTTRHDHLFSVGDQVYGNTEENDEAGIVDETGIKLANLLSIEDSFRYTYELERPWVLEVQALEFLFYDCLRRPMCYDGEGICPTEDGAKIDGLDNVVKSLRERPNEFRQERKAARRKYKPKPFEAINVELRKLHEKYLAEAPPEPDVPEELWLEQEQERLLLSFDDDEIPF